MIALWSTLGAFALILVLARLKVPLALAVVAGTVGVGMSLRFADVLAAGGEWSWPAAGRALGETLRAGAWGSVEPRTLALVVVTVLLVGLSRVMQAAGQMKEIVRLARMLLRRPAVAMMALPALIGLLPMPGGALFSAPMVQAAAGESGSKASMLSAVNYWFRHIWEYWWPLYPGVMLAMELTKSQLWTFIPLHLPMTLFMFVSGLWIFRGSHPNLHAMAERAPAGTGRQLGRVTSSIWVILLVWGAVTALVRATPAGWIAPKYLAVMQKYVPLTCGLLVSLAWTVRLNRLPRGQMRQVFTHLSLYQLGILVLSVMVFRSVLEDVDAPARIGAELKAAGIPVVLVVAALPFIAGAVTGLAVGFVGASFPIVLGLVASPEYGHLRPYVALAYAFGHLGQMMSPMHLCQVVSNRYFKTGFAPVYRY